MDGLNRKQRPDSDELAVIVSRLESGEKASVIAKDYGVTKASIGRWALYYESEILGPAGCRVQIQMREQAARDRTKQEQARRRDAIASSLQKTVPSMADLLGPPQVRKAKDYMDNIAVFG